MRQSLACPVPSMGTDKSSIGQGLPHDVQLMRHWSEEGRGVVTRTRHKQPGLLSAVFDPWQEALTDLSQGRTQTLVVRGEGRRMCKCVSAQPSRSRAVHLSRFDMWCKLIGVNCSAFSISSFWWQHVSGLTHSGWGPCDDSPGP